jgi:hypothetical protein
VFCWFLCYSLIVAFGPAFAVCERFQIRPEIVDSVFISLRFNIRARRTVFSRFNSNIVEVSLGPAVAVCERFQIRPEIVDSRFISL